MPDPKRFASRQVNVLVRLGYDPAVSAMLVGIACESAAKAIGSTIAAPGTWLHEVALAAAERVALELRRQREATVNRTMGGSTT
jgi:hypothetical protein